MRVFLSQQRLLRHTLRSSLVMTILLFSFLPCQSAISFDGVDDYVDLGNITDALSSMTISVWIKPSTQTNTFRDVIGKWSIGSYGWWLEIRDTAATKIAFGTSGSSYIETTNSVMTTGTWNHIVVRHGSNGTIREIYVNGINVAVTDHSGGAGTIGTSTASLRIGGNNSTNRYFTGSIDDVRIYNRTLSTTEVEALYKAKRKRIGGSLANDLVAHYEMDGGEISSQVSTVIDVSGNSNHGTGIGGASLIYSDGVLQR